MLGPLRSQDLVPQSRRRTDRTESAGDDLIPLVFL
jgi:hypothetical protein